MPPPPVADDVPEPAEKVVFRADLCGHVVEIMVRNVQYVVRVVKYDPRRRKHLVSSFGMDLQAAETSRDRELDLNRLFAKGQLWLAGRSELGGQSDCVESPRGRGGRFSEFLHTSTSNDVQHVSPVFESKAVARLLPAQRARGDSRAALRPLLVGVAPAVGPSRSAAPAAGPQRPSASSAARGLGGLRP